MKRLSICFVISFLLLCGCSSHSISKKPIYEEANKVMELINGSQWEMADNAAQGMQKIFNKNKWKYQLLGDESEYTGLHQEISKLKVSIEEKDKPEAKRNIVIIQDHIRSIYLH
ncbi:DUF4363 family protein [Bacillus sp. REN16]|uniref:DUF4363 family protein n=1 Tax=Bacillus sp. REN16 TaxID=2887296 RepID=UPI001E53FF1C|nr:DUF4363 family protein [Bacillus sp. REN16]MCC3357308.1 DUF4363 family protein [Bacillus sp. REN16]